MAFANETRAVNTGLKLDLSAVIYHTYQRIVDYRAYRRTVAELSDLSNHDLADLGMNRTSIHDMAMKAVYGSKA